MKKISGVLLIFIFLLAACTPQPAAEPNQPSIITEVVDRTYSNRRTTCP